MLKGQYYTEQLLCEIKGKEFNPKKVMFKIWLQRIIITLAVVSMMLLQSCSAERKCRKTITKAKRLGCLTTDSVVIKDTLIIPSFDTLVKFTTINEVDTLIVHNGGFKTVVFTKWKTREVRVVQRPDTVIRERKVPQMVIKNTDCPKVSFWCTLILVIVFLLIGYALGYLIGGIKTLGKTNN
jgi:hypothetical protein